MTGSPHLHYWKSSIRSSVLVALTRQLFPLTALFLFIYFLLLRLNTQVLSHTSTGRCDLSEGKWIRDPAPPLYTNETCEYIQPDQNCRKNGRPDSEYLNWRWKPKQCELPSFDPTAFLSLVRGKRLLFVGDSLARNHQQSLLCAISQVEKPRLLYKRALQDIKWEFSSYNFVLAIFWSPLLVKFHESSNVFQVHVDSPEEVWASKLAEYDIVVVSAGQWFFRPSVYYINDTAIGRNEFLQSNNLTDLKFTYGIKAAYETTFRYILQTSGFRGLALIRTASVSHFERGKWSDGGTCDKTRPAIDQSKELSWTPREMRRIQLEESENAARTRKDGARLRVIDVTRSMFTRRDGHPGRYRDGGNSSISDCLHWCLPGPIDTWNQLILQILNEEGGDK